VCVRQCECVYECVCECCECVCECVYAIFNVLIMWGGVECVHFFWVEYLVFRYYVALSASFLFFFVSIMMLFFLL